MRSVRASSMSRGSTERKPWMAPSRIGQIEPKITTATTTKKIWIAAVSANPSEGTDPSSPAFYLPGQEYLAGNSKAYWVLESCKAAASTRTTTRAATMGPPRPDAGHGTKGPLQMQLGMVGLGRMGANMAERLVRGGHRVVGFDVGAPAREPHRRRRCRARAARGCRR